MKHLTIILLISLSCSRSIVPVKYENQFYITRQYYGKILYTRFEKNYTVVVTELGIITLCGQQYVPTLVHGYVRTEPCYQDVAPFIRARLEHKYLSWPGSKEYKIKTW